MNWQKFRHWAMVTGFGIALPALAYTYFTKQLTTELPPSIFEELGIDPARIDLHTLSPQIARTLGLVSMRPATELVIVLISSAECTANDIPGFREAIKSIPERLQLQLAENPQALGRVIGIATDRNTASGADYLLRLANFDEIIAGGSWLNTATEKFLWGQHSVSGYIPQIILVERTVTWSETSVRVEKERVLDTFDGPTEIMKWVQSGAQFPMSSLHLEDQV